MQINIQYDPSVNSLSATLQADFKEAVTAAVDYFDNAIEDNVTVTIDFGWGKAGTHTIQGFGGENWIFFDFYSYAQVDAAFTAKATFGVAAAAAATLPQSDPTHGANFAVDYAQAQLLGLSNSLSSTPIDIALNTSDSFDFNPDTRGVDGGVDAVGLLEHEISETLGRFESLGSVQGSNVYTLLDMYRYSSPGVRDLAPGPGSFSYDGQHLMLPFNNPSNGEDPGDWAPSITSDSFAVDSNSPALVSPTDLDVMESIGYQVAASLFENDFLASDNQEFLIQNAAGAVDVGQVAGGHTTFTAVAGLGPEWKFVGDGDFLGQSRWDFLIENSSGAVAVGDVGLGATSASYTVVGALGPEWKFVGVGDFFLTGASDFLIENTGGAVDVGNMLSGHAVYTQIGALGPEWSFVGTGDFRGDGETDFLIENSAGAVDIGEVVGGQAQYANVAALGHEWSFRETGNFLGDGKTDFLIENSAGAVDIGEVVNGQAQYTPVTALGPEWKFVGAGDYLGEGHDQFLIENTAGAVFVGDWLNGQMHFTQVSALGSEWSFH